MSKANKTQKTKISPVRFLNDVSPDQKRDDCLKIMDMQKEITGLEPEMWGAIIGFGDYHYKYESGREGDFFRLGFAPRAQNISIYIMPGYQDFDDELSRLGKHKVGKSCLYIKRLSDVDEEVLREIMAKGYRLMEEKYPS
ncbi:MAG: DUF1801 domain-containing protein [Acidimicrobiales bacterium]|nr:DUF1801 domain-containing protein [Hyphomonadaceae bacterium]RZV43066.1 MAG: DUF1801 domain-containing protein [Acidimicrobiales bacterium]